MQDRNRKLFSPALVAALLEMVRSAIVVLALLLLFVFLKALFRLLMPVAF